MITRRLRINNYIPVQVRNLSERGPELRMKELLGDLDNPNILHLSNENLV